MPTIGYAQGTDVMDRAKALAGDAKVALDAGRFEAANTLYDQAITAIGDRYRRSGTLDDTGMKLVLAKSEAGKKAWSRAAHLKMGVVESRLALAASKVD
jgi:hypothetical protein